MELRRVERVRNDDSEEAKYGEDDSDTTIPVVDSKGLKGSVMFAPP